MYFYTHSGFCFFILLFVLFYKLGRCNSTLTLTPVTCDFTYTLAFWFDILPKPKTENLCCKNCAANQLFIVLTAYVLWILQTSTNHSAQARQNHSGKQIATCQKAKMRRLTVLWCLYSAFCLNVKDGILFVSFSGPKAQSLDLTWDFIAQTWDLLVTCKPMSFSHLCVMVCPVL